MTIQKWRRIAGLTRCQRGLKSVRRSPQFYGVWSFSKNKSAAKDLLFHISQKPAAAKLVSASYGYDLPSFRTMYDLDTWKTVEPPLGTVYGYPPRADEQTSIAGGPARPEVGVQIYNQAINTVMVLSSHRVAKSSTRQSSGPRTSSKARVLH